jgi:dihydrofolate reductase
MKIHRVEGILAVSNNNVVGQKDSIPWYHSGDFKHFKSTTMGHAVMMGYPTFIGMAKNYGRPGKIMLPGRTIFVVGREPFDSVSIDDSNVIMLPTNGPRDDIETALSMINPDQKLFISGGARIYRDYLPFAERVYLTKIDLDCPVDHDTVMLPEFVLGSWRTVTHDREEICDGIKASYITMASVI